MEFDPTLIFELLPVDFWQSLAVNYIISSTSGVHVDDPWF